VRATVEGLPLLRTSRGGETEKNDHVDAKNGLIRAQGGSPKIRGRRKFKLRGCTPD